MNDEKKVSPLARALGIVPESERKSNSGTFVVKSPSAPVLDKLDSDAEHARNTLYDMISKNNEAIDQLMEIARESMNPRAYEVLANMITGNAEIADKLLKVHSDKQKIDSGTVPNTGNTNVQINGNVSFVGTTNDLLTMVREQQKTNLIEQDEDD